MIWCDQGLYPQLKEKKTPTHSSASIKRHPTQEPVPAYISEKELCPKRETETTTTAPKNSFLWDEAYDILKKENPILVTEYEELLLRLEDETKPTLSEPRQVIIDAKTKIPQHDVLARRQMLQDIALFNLQKSQEGKLKTTFFGKQIVWQEAIGKFGLGVRWVQDYTRDALKDVPYAPIVMVAVALLLPLLTGPFTADSENHEGLLYVVSQIKYYIKMETLMLPDCLDAGVKSELNEQVKSLYKLVIEFQVQSVMRFDRSPTKNYIRSVIDYESWSTRLDLIKESEKTIRNNMQGAASWTIVQKLENLKQEAQDSRKTVEEIAHTTQKIEQHMSDAEYRRCLDTLKASGFELDKESIQDFKGGLLKDSYQWVVENHDFKRWMAARSGQLLWIKGDPGKGKTMLLCGIVDELSHMANSCTNIAFAFCQANKETRNNASAVLRGLIYMLVKQQPSLITSISEESFSGDNAWFALQRAFINILNNPELQASYLVIDGLDECIEGRHRLLKLLVNHSSAHPNVKWVVSSRNWPEIEQDLDQATEMKLHLELNEEVLSTAIQSFITYKVDDLRTKKKDRPEIWKAVHDHLLANAKGTFLWVALVWKHLTEVPWWKVTEKLKEFPPGLDQIYERMMGQIKKLDDADLYKSVLRVSTTVLRPITLDEMMVYLDVPENSVEVLEEIVRGCGSFLSLQGNTVLLVHQSAKDFLLTQASGEVYPCGKDKAQHDIYSSSMHLLKGALRRDIYDLRAPGYPVEQIEVPCPDPLLAVRYACAHWIDHLLLCNDEGLKIELQEDGLVSRFFSQNYLHWLEVMSIMKSLPAAIKSIRKLEKSLETAGEPKALMLQVKDAVRFVQYTQFAIERSPLQNGS
ncbi:unnamed protein product [Penicillium salamii]|nr:unnamed protein product [Penicillium salamii]